MNLLLLSLLVLVGLTLFAATIGAAFRHTRQHAPRYRRQLVEVAESMPHPPVALPIRHGRARRH